MSLSTAIEQYGDTKLLHYLQEEIENHGTRKEEGPNKLIQMMKWHDPDINIDIQCTSLQLALSYQKSKKVIYKMIDIGGKQLAMMKDEIGNTTLHYACKEKNISMEIISKLLEMGGKELLMMNDCNGNTALHNACQNENASMEIISKLFEIGERGLLMKKG